MYCKNERYITHLPLPLSTKTAGKETRIYCLANPINALVLCSFSNVVAVVISKSRYKLDNVLSVTSCDVSRCEL